MDSESMDDETIVQDAFQARPPKSQLSADALDHLWQVGRQRRRARDRMALAASGGFIVLVLLAIGAQGARGRGSIAATSGSAPTVADSACAPVPVTSSTTRYAPPQMATDVGPGPTISQPARVDALVAPESVQRGTTFVLHLETRGDPRTLSVSPDFTLRCPATDQARYLLHAEPGGQPRTFKITRDVTDGLAEISGVQNFDLLAPSDTPLSSNWKLCVAYSDLCTDIEIR